MSMLRRVKSAERWTRDSRPRGCFGMGCRVTLTLECGHKQTRKDSAWNGGRVRCKECKT